jgi:hypothetical protein
VIRPAATVQRVDLRPSAPRVEFLADVGNGFPSTKPQWLFQDEWRVAHRAEAFKGPVDGRPWFGIGGSWLPGGTGVIGTLTIERDVPYGSTDAVTHMTFNSGGVSMGRLHERTVLTLRHTPDPSLASAK